MHELATRGEAGFFGPSLLLLLRSSPSFIVSFSFLMSPRRLGPCGLLPLPLWAAFRRQQGYLGWVGVAFFFHVRVCVCFPLLSPWAGMGIFLDKSQSQISSSHFLLLRHGRGQTLREMVCVRVGRCGRRRSRSQIGRTLRWQLSQKRAGRVVGASHFISPHSHVQEGKGRGGTVSAF